MKFLKELFAFQTAPPMGATARLTDTQKTVLLGIYTAPTPEMAYETMTGSENVTEAGKQLRNMGLINVDSNGGRAGITDRGQETLANNNLIDDTGQMTEEGQKVIDQQQAVKTEFEDATEAVAYPVLKKLI